MNKDAHSETLSTHFVTPMLLETEDKATIERISNRAVVQINFAYFNHAKVNFEVKVQAVCKETTHNLTVLFMTFLRFFGLKRVLEDLRK